MFRKGKQANPKALLAFCHIEKAAGTSMTHILRRIYLLRYASVRPMHSDSVERVKFFTSRDLSIARTLNPFLLAIGGHSVVPHGDLVDGTVRLDFITQLREPVARATSQYRYWVNRMGLGRSFDDFLKHPTSQNFQVKKIAGCEDLELAKANIAKHFLLAGTVNQFDEFLVLLANSLQMPLQLFTYNKQNVDKGERPLEIPDNFTDKLRERNQLDQKLYDWVDSELLSEYITRYAGDFYSDLRTFRALQENATTPQLVTLIDSIYRNVYLKPVSGFIRVANGLPYRGSYANK